MAIIQDTKDRLECLKLAVLLAQKGGGKSSDAIKVAEDFFQFIRKDAQDDRPVPRDRFNDTYTVPVSASHGPR